MLVIASQASLLDASLLDADLVLFHPDLIDICPSIGIPRERLQMVKPLIARGFRPFEAQEAVESLEKGVGRML